MNMRKIIAMLSAVLMLCAIVPFSVSASVLEGNFDDGNAVFSGSTTIEDGVLHWDSSTASWAHLTKGITTKANTDYVVSFKMKSSHSYAVSVKFMKHDWATTIASEKVSPTTEWAEYSVILNSGENTSILFMFQTNTEASVAQQFYIDDFSIVENTEPAVSGQIVNGDFETGSLSGWTAHQSTAISADAAHTGSYGANLKGNGGWGGMLNQDIPVEAGKTYDVSMWLKTNAVGTNIQVKDGGTSGNNLASDWFSKTAWTQLTFTVVPTTNVICINFCGGGNGNAEDVYVDDIVVTELKEPSFDGYITNGDFETGSNSPWTTYSGSTVSAEAAKDGDYGMYITNPTGGWGGTAYQDFTVEVGKTYVVMMDAKAISNGQNIQIQNNGANKASKWFTNTSWTTLTFEFTAEAATTRINICGGGTGGSEIIYVDNVFVFEKKAASNDGYVVNGDFETGTMDGLSPSQSTCVSRDAAKDGNFGLKMMGNGGWGGVGLWTINGLETGATYKIEMDMNAIEQGFNWTLWQDSTSSGSKYASGYFSTKAWTHIEKEFVANSSVAVLNINGGGTGNAETVYLDNLKITLVKPAHVCEIVELERVEADCENDGYVKYGCECGEGVYTETIESQGHNYVGVETLEATCDLTGEMTYTCDACGGSYTEEIPAWHDGQLTHVPAVEAIDCQNPGNIEYWTCPYCYEYFTDAYASEYINPWFIEITVDCVVPEGTADCATVPCTVCGNDVYGYGEHDVIACQGGVCGKCGDEIEGYGCANYDTPACEDGVCYYCGGFVAGFGHENGAWAPCLEGECAYGCGLTYPATGDHIDEDGNCYCDNCWSDMHDYDDNYDADCNVCGAIREINIIIEGGFSIAEDKDASGLAVKFDVLVEGLAIAEGKFTQADFTNATINGYKLIGMGAVADNGVSSVDVACVYLCELEEAAAAFAVRIINIPEAHYDTTITFTPYYIVEIDGVATRIEGPATYGAYSWYNW